jgi:large subunit ribosomal protein L9
MIEQEKHTKSSAVALLLLEDVHGLGRKGEVVEAKPGFARNYLVPQKRALIAEPNALRKQETLRAERDKQAAVDRTISEELARQVSALTLETHVKVDTDNHMYGSVSIADIVDVLAREGINVDRTFVRIGQPIRTVGLHEIPLKLKEGVECSFKLKVIPEGMDELPEEAAEVVAPIVEETPETPAEEE